MWFLYCESELFVGYYATNIFFDSENVKLSSTLHHGKNQFQIDCGSKLKKKEKQLSKDNLEK